MKATRTAEAIRIRRELAQLLRRLRAFRRDQLAASELAERVSVALAEAGSVRRFVALDDVSEGRNDGCRTGVARVDKRKLSDAGLATRPGELIAAPVVHDPSLRSEGTRPPALVDSVGEFAALLVCAGAFTI